MGYIGIDNLIADMTPEQKIMMVDFYSKFNNRSAINKQIVNIEPLYYHNVSVGSEFLTYAATKMYICLKISGLQVNTINAADVSIVLYDENNATNGFVANANPIWDTVALAAKYSNNNSFLENFYFSRLVTFVTYVKFIGYRITLI